jgi:hypothetical protein
MVVTLGPTLTAVPMISAAQLSLYFFPNVSVCLTVAWNHGPDLVSPSSCRGVHVRAADAACDDLDVDIVVSKWLWLELKIW